MSLFSRLWNDDSGAVVSVELMMILGLLMLALSAGAGKMRNAAQKNVDGFTESLQLATPKPDEIRQVLSIEHRESTRVNRDRGEARNTCGCHKSCLCSTNGDECRCSSVPRQLTLPPSP